eukprot:COSAG05_NODE_17637_length_322_cov_0.677130_1_plen_33_part_01
MVLLSGYAAERLIVTSLNGSGSRVDKYSTISLR